MMFPVVASAIFATIVLLAVRGALHSRAENAQMTPAERKRADDELNDVIGEGW